MEIKGNRLDRGFYKYQQEFEEKALSVLRSGWYVLGREVSQFEKEFAGYVGTKHCIGVASGLDALWIGMKMLGIGQGDEVIVQGNTYIASVMGITINGATPVFVEPDKYYNLDVSAVECKITPRTKAILVVHLYGQASNMVPIMELADKYGLRVIEDCAQSHGACCQEKMTGSLGDVGCFSFYPSKNIGAFGDAGAIVTDNEKLAEDIRIFRNYGSEKRYYNKLVGTNSRLDEMQAGLLRVRLKHVQECIEEREMICERYLRSIHNTKFLLPTVRKGSTTVWHQFVIRCSERERLIDFLKERQIDSIIHYPIPPHLAEAYQYLGYRSGSFPITELYADQVLSLPLYNGMTSEEQDYVIEAVNEFK